MPLGSGRAYTRFPALQSCSHGEHIKCSPARAELTINLVYARPLPRGSHPKCGAKLRMPSFLSAKARRKFDAGLLTLLDVVDADPAQKLYRYRKVPGAARAPTAAYELYREFRTNRRPLNVASVVSRTVRAGKFIYGGRRPPRPRGASLKQKLSFGKVRGQWRFIPRNSKIVENSLQICVDFR